jgi:hypothetical protein
MSPPLPLLEQETEEPVGMATKRVWTDNAKPYLNPYTSALLCPPSKIYMGVDVAPNPNPWDIHVSKDIHVIMHYVHNIKTFDHNSNISTASRQHFDNNYMLNAYEYQSNNILTRKYLKYVKSHMTTPQNT